MRLWFFAAFCILQVCALSSCIPGYNLYSGTCLKGYKVPMSRDDASSTCQGDGGSLVVITDYSIMSYVRSLVSGYPYSWIGMQCLGTSFESCLTDNGQRYRNDGSFYLASSTASPDPRFPNYYMTSDQKWQNSDGSLFAVFVCQISDAPAYTCENDYFLLYGKCYKQVNKGSQPDTEQQCASQGGNLASIHSEAESLALATIYANGAESYIGLVYEGGYVWLDGTPVSYTNIGQCSSSCNTPCYALVNQETTNYAAGQWYPVQDCKNQKFTAICKKNVESETSLSCPTSDFTGNGRIFSPGYPAAYPQQRCTYTIRASPGQVVRIQFNRIYLDSASTIYLSNELSGSSYFATITSSSYNSSTYYSSSNYLRVVFDSTQSNLDYIFNNVWLADYQSGYPPTTTPIPTTMNFYGSGCNQGQLTYYGTITSPDYPGNYYNNLNCTYLLNSGYYGYIIQLVFTDFYTESGCDFVSIYDGPDESYPLLDRLSGNPGTPMYYYSSSPYMTVAFTTDGSVVYRGFSANFDYMSSPTSMSSTTW